MKKILLIIFIIIFLVTTVGAFIYYQQGMKYQTNTDITIEIDPGDDITVIADKLSINKAVCSRYFFIFYAAFIDPAGRQNILPGIHILPAGSNLPTIFNLIQSNPNREISLTFPEGLTTDEILTKINHELSIPISELHQSLDSTNSINAIPFIYPDNENFEGFLFPDTYRFKVTGAADEVIPRFLTNFQQKWQTATAQASVDDLDDYEILILASIIEKEANSSLEEKKIISGILHNRLNNGIALGVNSTLNYILDQPQRVFSDYEINYDSPYNTYQNLGLPPTPICNPGLDSIIAALDPAETDYWYFLHTPTGQIIYAKTLSEQEANIEQYL
ncbi:MAG: endolytic transglycosylase MltG [Patescibacteria group bacterium]